MRKLIGLFIIVVISIAMSSCEVSDPLEDVSIQNDATEATGNDKVVRKKPGRS